MIALSYQLKQVVLYLLSFVRPRKPVVRHPYLQGNFYPVSDELLAEQLPIVNGKVPEDFPEGMYVRTGSNPHFVNLGESYHWFMGDGMLHGVLLKDGQATYANKFVRTEKWKFENETGRNITERKLDFTPDFLLRLVVNGIYMKLRERFLGEKIVDERNTANTSLQYHANRIFALVESAPPTQVLLPQLETIGVHDFDGKLDHEFTAHPKVDAKTGEMMFFGYSLKSRPYCQYAVVNAEGVKSKSVAIELEVPVMMHDFAITENYSIFMDLPFTFRTEKIIQGEAPFDFEASRPARFGILPRHSTNANKDMKWFSTQSCFVFHVANSWENVLQDGSTEIVLVACRSKTTTSAGMSERVSVEDRKNEMPYLYEWRFNLTDGSIHERELCSFAGEFPVINEAFTGYKNRYVYFAQMETLDYANNPTKQLLFDSIVKYDLESSSVVATQKIGENQYAGEAYFVKSANNDQQEEDQGYLATYAYDQNSNTSFFVLLSAKDLHEVCRVKLPRRVPYGFHGKFFTQAQIDSQQF